MNKLIEEYRKDFQEAARSAVDEPITPPGLRGLIVGTLNKYCRGDGNRKQFLKALTGYSSTKDLTAAEWIALRWFLDPEAENVILSLDGERAIDNVLAAAMPPQEKLI
jgi:hypothetical protein